MKQIKLRRLIKKREISDILQSVTDGLTITVAVHDEKGNLIFGTETVTGAHFIIKDGDVAIGQVTGPEKAKIVAELITSLVECEKEKRALGEETLEKYKEITILYDIAEQIAACIDTTEVASMVIGEAKKVIHGDNVSLMLHDKKTDTLDIIAATGIEYEPKVALKAGEGIAGAVLMSGKAEIINDVSKDTRFVPGKNKIHSLMCVPLRFRENTIGLINVSTVDKHAYRSEDLKLLSAMAFQTAVAIENARLYEDLHSTFISTVYGLAMAIGKRDPYTGKHTKRVMEYSTAIGREMGMKRSDLKKLQIAAILHDIGKIGIPDNILNKHDSLTKAEFNLYRKHPAYGEDLVKNIKQLDDVRPAIRHHHERFDGMGYPDGLSGYSIHVMARIIAVADSFDAITSDRPYRKGLNQVHALEQLKRNMGTQFDPDIVKTFFHVFRKYPALFKEE